MPIFNDKSFKDMLTNNIISFEQLGPDIQTAYIKGMWIVLCYPKATFPIFI